MGSSNDLSMKGMISGDIDPAVIPDETIIHFHAVVMIERASDSVVSKVNISGGGFYASMGFFNGGHDHSSEVLWRQDYYLIIVILSLVMVCLSREKVCLLIGCTSFVMKGEMVFC